MSSLLFLRWLPSCSFKSLDKAGHDSCEHSPRTLAPRACVQQATPSLPLNLGPTAACSAGPASWMQKLSSKVPLRHSHQHVLITSRVWKHGAHTRARRPGRAEASSASCLSLGTRGAGALLVEHGGPDNFPFALWLLWLLCFNVLHFLVKPRTGKDSVDTGTLLAPLFSNPSGKHCGASLLEGARTLQENAPCPPHPDFRPCTGGWGIRLGRMF